MKRTTLQCVGKWLAGTVLLGLVAVEVTAVWTWCDWTGYLTVRDFFITALCLSFFNTALAASARHFLPVRVWQVSLGTVALLLLAWHNPKPGLMHYWAAAERLHTGMSVRQVQDTMAPYPIGTGWYDGAEITPATVAEAKALMKPNFTGTVVCNDKLGYGNITIIGFKNGRVTYTQ